MSSLRERRAAARADALAAVPKPNMTEASAAAYLGYASPTMLRLMRLDGIGPEHHVIPGSGRGPEYRYEQSVLDEWIDEHGVHVAKERRDEPLCGSDFGYYKHYRRNEPACAPCKAAASAYVLRRRAARRATA